MAAASPAPPKISGTRAQQISEIQAWILQQTGSQPLADSYAAFCAEPAYKNVSAKECYVGWFITESKVFPDLFKDLQKGLGAPGQLAQDGENALTYSFGVSGIAGWFFRGLKIVLGGVLIVLGLSRITGAANAITQAAAKVPVIPV